MAYSFSHRAFTLIEVVISSALMALILVSAYLCLSAGIDGRRIVEPRADIFQTARVTMALLTADLRAACPLPGDSPFLGMQRLIGATEADNLDFATHNYTPRHAHEGDFCETSYFVNQDARTGRFSLWRRRNPTLALDPLSGGSQEEIATDIRGIRYEFSDGEDWYDNWGAVEGQAKAQNSQRDQSNLQGLPQAVRITLSLDADPQAKAKPANGQRTVAPPLVFQTVVSLNLAAVSQDDNASGGGASSSAPTTPSQPGGSQ